MTAKVPLCPHLGLLSIAVLLLLITQSFGFPPLSLRCGRPPYHGLHAGKGAGRDEVNEKAFFAEVAKRSSLQPQPEEPEEDMTGYDFRDILVEKWGESYDVQFQRVDSFGFRGVYLNVMPFKLGSRPFQHETEYDYLCHLQAVVEILLKYDQMGNVLYAIHETKKVPRLGNPIVAVPLRLDLSPEQVNKIMGYT